MHACMHAHSHPHTHAHTYTHTRTTHTYRHTNIHIYTHTSVLEVQYGDLILAYITQTRMIHCQSLISAVHL